jgi:hypothetical protein
LLAAVLESADNQFQQLSDRFKKFTGTLCKNIIERKKDLELNSISINVYMKNTDRKLDIDANYGGRIDYQCDLSYHNPSHSHSRRTPVKPPGFAKFKLFFVIY